MKVLVSMFCKRCIAGIAITGGVCLPVHAATLSGDWLGRLMMFKVTPVHLSSEISGINGEIYTSDVIIPGIELSYFFTDNWAVEFQGGRFSHSYSIMNSDIGDFKVADIVTTTVSAIIQYHFYLNSHSKPYFGFGANYAHAHAVKPALGISNFSVRDITSAVVNAGVDYHFNKSWFVSTSLHYILSPAYGFNGKGFSSTVKMDTVVYGLGLGCLF